MKFNNINNPSTINFNEPSKNKILKIPNNHNYSVNIYKNDIGKKIIKKNNRNKSKKNSISVVNFNSEINNQLTVDLADNNYNSNNKFNDNYYKSCNNFYINNKYNFISAIIFKKMKKKILKIENKF